MKKAQTRMASMVNRWVAGILLILWGFFPRQCPGQTASPFAAWKHAGSVWILTTREGANLPEGALEKDFPLLVRLHRDFFDFKQARGDGGDLRFATAGGLPLVHEIEQWDGAKGEACVWVRVPEIRGNARQELKLYWGNAGAKAEAGRQKVFGEDNGYRCVWHLDGKPEDAVGTLESRDTGTQDATGVIGRARRFGSNRGVFCGDKITRLPSGAAPHTTQAWFRTEKSNSTLIGWGNEGGGRGSKVRMQLRSPPHLHIDSDFSDVDAPERVPSGQWVHVVHTYDGKEGRIYLDGKLAGSAKPRLNIRSPSRLWLGGWYDQYSFEGDLDEARVSHVARSANWVRLEHENQKILSSLVGPVVQPPGEFRASREEVTVDEGERVELTASCGGALKLYWIVRREGSEAVVAVDRKGFSLDVGRVTGDQRFEIELKAVYPDGVKSKTTRVLVREKISDPEFKLAAPAQWDGRSPFRVKPQLTNLEELVNGTGGRLHYRWKVDGIAVIRDEGETAGDQSTLTLSRAMNSGPMAVTLTVSNGGKAVSQSVIVEVREPAKDPWVARMPETEEMPEDNQFYAREPGGEGTLHCQGALKEPAEGVFLKLYADGKLIRKEEGKPGPGNRYLLTTRLRPGLIRYRIEFGSVQGGQEKVVHRAENLVCGDAYLIDGQSNAEATDVGKEDPSFTSDWIRSYGSTAGGGELARLKRWGNAVCRDRRGGKAQIGYWGMELAKRLVEKHQVPVCFINGAVGGSRIDQHQRGETEPDDVETIYGRLLWRVRQARLSHGIRGIFWHQGENDQGADGPTGGFGHETYREYFIAMAGGWKRDYPNLKNIYVFQIWPKACSMGINGSDNRLREVQRTLPRYFSNLSVMSTLGIQPPGGCHFPPEGYAGFAKLIGPLVERDSHGLRFEGSITAPNLVAARYGNPGKTELELEFDQPVVWQENLADQFHLESGACKVVSGTVAGNRLRLKLSGPEAGGHITYLDSKSWSQQKLLLGANGIAALTFCEVVIGK